MSLTLAQAHRRLRLVDRVVKRGQGKLPGSSALPFSVPLGVAMVVVETAPSQLTGLPKSEREEALWSTWPKVGFAPSVHRAVHDTVTGVSELWFDQDGNAFASFADKQDATMFRLALDGDLS